MNRKVTIFSLLSLCLIGALVMMNKLTPGATAVHWQADVDPWVLETAAAEGESEFIVFLAEQADLSASADLETKLEKGTYVYETLSALAAETQVPILAELEQLNAEYRSYWVANMIWVRGDMEVIQRMAERPDVSHLYANPTVHFDPPTEEEIAQQMATLEWNIAMVNADDAWAAGYNGQGVVIGGQDTGYDWDHPALKVQYRGWNGSTADHNYNWHDSIQSGSGGVCGLDSPEPCDDVDHGTHTMGSMVGDDGAGNQIGMAPGARWIGCRNMDVGNGTPTTYSECYQWFIAPTDLNDQNPNPAMAPHVINNSWSCPPSEGCTDPNVMLTIVNNVRAAGILTAHSAGNSGSSCSTVNAPAAIYDSSFTVGSTSSADFISSFSSRGPVILDGSNRLKPDISAPGQSVRSSVPGTSYSTKSGTSMAAPHVAGLTALLISADPSLAGDVDSLEEIISIMAVPKTTGQSCGSIPGSEVPNHTYGYGRIDAFRHGLGLEALVSDASVNSGEMITYTFTLTHAHILSATNNAALTSTIPAGTTFVTATMPFTFDGTEVQWDFASMDKYEGQTVELVVQVDAPSGLIDHTEFGAWSDEVSTATVWGSGSLQTNVIPVTNFLDFMPVILSE